MGMSNNIYLMRGIKVKNADVDFDELDYPEGVEWMGNGEHDTDEVVVGVIVVDLEGLDHSMKINAAFEEYKKMDSAIDVFVKRHIDADAGGVENYAVATYW